MTRRWLRRAVVSVARRGRAIGLAAAAFAAAAGPSRAGEPLELPPLVYRVADVQTEPWRTYPQGPWAIEFVRFGDHLYFRGWDGVHGAELWRTDGTPEGTELVADICPGACSSVPTELRALLGAMYFQAIDPEFGAELWRSDGTPEGTEMVADIRPGAAGSRPGWFAELEGEVFFQADDGTSGPELWRTDGSRGGTSLAADIVPGSIGAGPTVLVPVGSTLFFTAEDGGTGRELWKTDGTAGGTALVVDACPGPDDGIDVYYTYPFTGPALLRPVGDRLVFVTSTYPEPCEGRVWTSDGTPEGSQPLSTLEVDALFPFPAPDGAVLFGANTAGIYDDTLWRTDGTPDGTWQIASVRSARAIGVVKDTVFFGGADDDHGYELWRTDGTAGGTSLVKDIRPGPAGSMSFIWALGSTESPVLYFYADDGATGMEPWQSDGTTAGTILLRDIHPGAASSIDPVYVPAAGGVADDRFVFPALDPEHGFEPWITDGSPEGTTLLRDIDTQASGLSPWLPGLYFEIEERAAMAAVESGIVFPADDTAAGREPWFSDGTAAGTAMIADLCPGECSTATRGFVPLAPDGIALFLGEEGSTLWKTDGTLEGTEALSAEAGGWRLSSWRGTPPRGIVEGSGLWVSDGTPEGTLAVFDGYPSEATPAGPHAFFSGSDGLSGYELYVTDGTPEGTSLVLDIGEDPLPLALAALGSSVVFSADDQVQGREPWFSDGTAEGTYLLADLRPGPDSSMRQDPLAESMRAGDWVYIAADDGLLGEELWRTAGGAPELVADLHPGSGGSAPRPLAAFGERLFFAAWDPQHGRELWLTDGTPAGTSLVRDLNPGPASGIVDTRVYFNQLRPAAKPRLWRKRLYFAATDGASGLELWSSDGTPEGTQRLRDIHPGPGSSSPSGFAPFGDRLFFAATDGTTGFELWAVKAPELVFADGFESGDTSGWSQTVP